MELPGRSPETPCSHPPRRVARLGPLLAIAWRFALTVPAIAMAQSPAIGKARAIDIARDAAGCKSVDVCVLRGGLDAGRWVFVVSFVAGRDADGRPRFVPGGFVGSTVGRDGRVDDRMPGL
ncbi:MAG: hypothetical protein KDH15_01920 [Rhodocyclaceae bacterium]|nr:hypothetical protein [Rhodocyclaceae bacterium]